MRSRHLPQRTIQRTSSKHWQRATDLLDVMEAVDSLDDLSSKGFPPSLRLHKLKEAEKVINWYLKLMGSESHLPLKQMSLSA